MWNPWFRNAKFVRERAEKFLTGMGYENVVYEGTDANLAFGGYVWYQATHRTDPKILFTIRLRRQDDDIKNTYERVLNAPVKGFVTTNQ